MSYHELLELYKKKELSKEKEEQVEADIERHEAISDYLFDQEEQEETLFQDGIGKETDDQFIKNVNHCIRKAFMKMGAVVIAITLVVVLFVLYGLPQLVSRRYYDPGKKIGSNTTQMSLDMAVYSELELPAYQRQRVNSEAKGYGNYEITIPQEISYNDTFTNVSGKIERGKLWMYDDNSLKRPSFNAFAWFQIYANKGDRLSILEKNQKIDSMAAGGDAKRATSQLKELDEHSDYIGYVTLNRIMDYKDFTRFTNDLDIEYGGGWCAVVTSPFSKETMFNTSNIGFCYQNLIGSNLQWDKKKYPELLTTVKEYSDKDMKKHFISMLNYMAYQKQFNSMMDIDAYELKSAASYVKKHGLQIYGFVIITDKKNLIKLNNKKEVYEISTSSLH